ncbi:MAG: response regulator [Prevotellaceae bacterium]|jgi:signal transduction histidine kinase/DNA-binding response OmpR family regulator/ligand-binding sensor domain-containing protein|nr:response regulator [Prevotellaceae bacterium]
MNVHAREVAFRSINKMFGISVREVTSICQDDNGFVWAAARTCILRVSADEQHSYELPLETSNVVQLKIAYRHGLLAVATQNGQVFRYDALLDRFERWFTLSDILSHDNWVTNLLIDDAGTVWVSTNIGLYRWKDNELRPFDEQCRGFSYVARLDSNTLAALSEPYIYKIDIDGGNYCREKLYEGCRLSVSSACYDKTMQRLWLGTYNEGLWQLDMAAGTLSEAALPGFPKLIVRDILLPVGGSPLIVAIDGAGIWELNRDGTRLLDVNREDLNDASSLPGNRVHALMLDDAGRMWVATHSNGLSVSETTSEQVEHLVHHVNDPQSLIDNQVNRIFQDSRGNLWMATNSGVSRRNASSMRWTHFFKDEAYNSLSITSDGQGHILVGTYGQRLHVLGESDGREIPHFFGNDTIDEGALTFDFFRDSEGDIWMGGVKGNIYCYNPAAHKLREYSAEPVYSFAEWMPGTILLGCMYGLIMLDKESGSEQLLLSNCTVFDIAVVGRNIYLCTSGNGLLVLNMDSGQVTRITTQAGLPSNYLSSIVQSGNLLWIGTESGLCSYDPVDRKVRTFGGIPILSEVSYNINAATRLSDGRLAFGSNNGAILFHPRNLQQMQPHGRIFFSDIRVTGRSIRTIPDMKPTVPIDSLQTLSLSYPHNSFTLNLFPVGNVSPGSSFAWWLEGEENGWSEYTQNRYINYTNLPAGSYQLHVKLYDGSVLAERSLKIVVTPPFWQRRWFELLIVILVVGLLLLFVRSYLNRLHRRYAEEKINFFVRMSHDIRTSLTLIKAPADELGKESALSEWGGRCLRLLSEQVERLTDTTTRLLDFQKLDIGREQPLFVDTNLVELLERRISVHESYARAHGIEITHSLPDGYHTAVDVRMIEQVVDNFMTNAIKYSQAGTRIEITFTGNEKEWMLRVKDQGIGISREAQRKLFREFYRSDNAVNSQIIGSGIGLLVTRKYVNLHDGTITVESALGKGSTFEVHIPHRLLLQEVSAPIETDEATAADEASEQVDTGMNVLIVEDNSSLRHFMKQALRHHFNVSTAANGEEALEMIHAAEPDLIVSDIVMPVMDGFELCRRLKSDTETSHIPVILLTALSDKVDQLKGLGLGADDYLLKPFDMTLLVSRITTIMRNRRTVLDKALNILNANKAVKRRVMENKINDEFILKAIECVRANISNLDFGKDEFASAMCLSQSLLFKKIKALTNLSIVEFIREIRLNYSMELLRAGELSVADISMMCGYSTPAYFSRVFKEFFGITPSEAQNI